MVSQSFTVLLTHLVNTAAILIGSPSELIAGNTICNNVIGKLGI